MLMFPAVGILQHGDWHQESLSACDRPRYEDVRGLHREARRNSMEHIDWPYSLKTFFWSSVSVNTWIAHSVVAARLDFELAQYNVVQAYISFDAHKCAYFLKVDPVRSLAIVCSLPNQAKN